MSKVVLITGTSSGFGFLTAQTLAKQGNTVYATMRGVEGKNAESAQKLRDWASENDANLTVLELDVTNQETIDAAFATLLENEGQLDVVVNNAGYAGMGVLEAFSIEDIQNQYDVNVFGVVRVTNAALPQLRKQGSGLIINISSVVGRVTFPFMGPYISSKFALEALSETYRYELAPLGIDVNVIEPGAYPTEIFGKMAQPTNTALNGDYGETTQVMQTFQKGMEGMFTDPQDPQLIADAVRDLIDAPAGKRAFRTPVDGQGLGEAAKQLNELQENITAGVLSNFGIGKKAAIPPQ